MIGEHDVEADFATVDFLGAVDGKADGGVGGSAKEDCDLGCVCLIPKEPLILIRIRTIILVLNICPIIQIILLPNILHHIRHPRLLISNNPIPNRHTWIPFIPILVTLRNLTLPVYRWIGIILVVSLTNTPLHALDNEQSSYWSDYMSE